MKKTRILRRINRCGDTKYVIQQKHFLFWWWWVDAWVNSSAGAMAPTDSFDTYEEARANLCKFQ